MSKFKGTKEAVEISEINLADYFDLAIITGNDIVCRLQGNEKDVMRENANIFTNALNTIQKCDLMPSELLKENEKLKERRNELIVAFQEVRNILEGDHPISDPVEYCTKYINDLLTKINEIK